MKRYTPSATTHRRSGFTLLELLMVIAVIAILVALLTAALQGVRIKARIAQVGSEISQLDTAVTKFNSTYNIDPPSSLNIPAAGGTWTAIDRSKVRAIWPQFDFTTNGGLGNTTAKSLCGAECLVFFLGGFPLTSGTKTSMTGFSKNPITPWSAAGTNREGPYFEFDSGRLVDLDGDAFPEFLDPLPAQTAPYQYYASQGKSYVINNTSAPEQFNILPVAANNPQKIYLKSEKVGTVGKNVPQRSESFQIISPGLDGIYGPGGIYTDGSELTGARSTEADNITNFSAGPLKP